MLNRAIPAAIDESQINFSDNLEEKQMAVKQKSLFKIENFKKIIGKLAEVFRCSKKSKFES